MWRSEAEAIESAFLHISESLKNLCTAADKHTANFETVNTNFAAHQEQIATLLAREDTMLKRIGALERAVADLDFRIRAHADIEHRKVDS